MRLAQLATLSVLVLLSVCGPAVGQSERPAQAPARIVLADRIAAVVNKEVITVKELESRTQRIAAQLRRQGAPLPPEEVLQRQVLERMITDLVQVQFAKESGVTINEADLDRTLTRIAQQNGLSLPNFRQAVEREGIEWEKFRDDIRSEMLISRLREREVDSKIHVSDAEIDALLEQGQTSPSAPPEYDLSHILVRVPEQAGPEQIEARRRRAAEALAQLRSGVDFRQVAVTFSDAPDALQGGGMGWRSADRLPELFVEALAAMKPGEVTDVLRSPAGFHIVRVNDRRGGTAGPSTVAQTHVRHILVRMNELVSETDALRKLNILRERVRQGADFGELARLNSDDASAARGGDLGWVIEGDTVPDFERAMNALKISQVSEPVRSPFGFHLIQVLDRRVAQLPDERKRQQARRVLGERRADEAYQEFVRQLRDVAFVEHRLDER
jgi:peptidyl-prolyl cis-trans isomerase SurA